jgi:hypothetical protein
MKNIGFDLISDLNLSPNDNFNWAGKATSLYCLIAGNISSDLRTIVQTLTHISKFYHRVFYIFGTLEYNSDFNIIDRTAELISATAGLPKVCVLYRRVAVVDGIAIVGINGWNNVGNTISVETLLTVAARYDDITYLHNSIHALQKHLDIKKIIIVTNGVPNEMLYFGEAPDVVQDQLSLHTALTSDSERKVTHWVFGSYQKSADNVIDNIVYLNNPYSNNMPYWAKRIMIVS